MLRKIHLQAATYNISSSHDQVAKTKAQHIARDRMRVQAHRITKHQSFFFFWFARIWWKISTRTYLSISHLNSGFFDAWIFQSPWTILSVCTLASHDRFLTLSLSPVASLNPSVVYYLMALKLFYRLYFYPHFRLCSMRFGDDFRTLVFKFALLFSTFSYIVFTSKFHLIEVRDIKIGVSIRKTITWRLSPTHKWFCWY